MALHADVRKPLPNPRLDANDAWRPYQIHRLTGGQDNRGTSVHGDDQEALLRRDPARAAQRARLAQKIWHQAHLHDGAVDST